MKICFFLISDGWGGAENVVYHLAVNIAKKGHEVSIILNEETYPYFKDLKDVDIYNIGPVFDYQRFMERHFKLHLPESLTGPRILGKAFRFNFGPILKYLNYKKVKSHTLYLIKKIDPDLIHFHNPKVLEIYPIIYRYLNKPTIYTSHGLEISNIINPIKRYLFDDVHILKKFNVITAVSKALLKDLNVNGTINIIENGLDIESLKKVKKYNLKKYGINNGYKILFPGGDKKFRGGNLVIEAIKILKDKNVNVHLFIAKEVAKNSYLRELVNKDKLEDNVTFLGTLKKEKYLRVLKSCDLLIQPTSGGDWPGLVAFEALTLQKPVITTTLNYRLDIFQNGKNCLFVNRNPQDIAKKLIIAIRNKNQMIEYLKNSYNVLRKLDWKNTVDKYLTLYRLILKEKET